MSFSPKPPFDPEIAASLKDIPKSPPLTEAVVLETRKMLAPMYTKEAVLTDPGILHEEVKIPGPGGSITLAILRSKSSVGGLRPGIYYIHGGGMIYGSRFFFAGLLFDWIKELDAVLISVEYRLSPEHSDPDLVEDCYEGLKWVGNHASELGINSEKIMIAGHSAGGGLAAGTALLARDLGGPRLYAQCLVYPMLDDRMITTSSKQFMDEGTWTGKNNIVAWDWLLSGNRGKPDDKVSIYAAPARAKDLSGLPSTFIEVGSAELFRDENVAYATKLWEHGVQAELHVWPGACHGYDVWMTEAQVTKIALETRMRWLKKTLL